MIKRVKITLTLSRRRKLKPDFGRSLLSLAAAVVAVAQK
jgi:hypothetical protein